MSNDADRTDVIRVGGGTLSISDGVNIEAGSGNKANYAIRIVKGTVNISGGYFHTSNSGSCELIYLEAGYASSFKANLNISGGVFECDGDPKYLINCQDTYLKKCSIIITGGTFVGWNPAESQADLIDGKPANWVADGYEALKTTYNGKDAWVVTKK